MSITLNVSGKIFKVSRDILRKSELFNGLLTDCEIDNEIAIDRSAKLFKHVHAYLLDNDYPYPRKYYSELDYYLVPYDIDLLYDSTKKWKEEYDGRIKKIENILEVVFYKTPKEEPSGKCLFPDCVRDGTWDGRCGYHRNDCCHRFEIDSQDDDEKNNWCDNETYGGGFYCEDHILDYIRN